VDTIIMRQLAFTDNSNYSAYRISFMVLRTSAAGTFPVIIMEWNGRELYVADVVVFGIAVVE
jgi:hypothetical protein